MEPAVVVPVDPPSCRELDVRDRLVGAVVEDGGADAFGLVDAVDRLHQGVVVRVADASDRGCDLLEREVIGQHYGCVLTGFNWSLQHRLLGETLAALHR